MAVETCRILVSGMNKNHESVVGIGIREQPVRLCLLTLNEFLPALSAVLVHGHLGWERVHETTNLITWIEMPVVGLRGSQSVGRVNRMRVRKP